jgi:acyl-CoA hydrolase
VRDYEEVARLERARVSDKEELANLRLDALKIAIAKYFRNATSNLVIQALIEHVETMHDQFKEAKEQCASESNITFSQIPRVSLE